MKKPTTLTKKDAVLKPDLCIIGASSAGLSIAATGALLGLSVVLVSFDALGADEPDLAVAALIASANRAHLVRNGVAFGVGRNRDEPDIDYSAVRRRLREVVASQNSMTSFDRYRAMGVRVVESDAHFTDPETVAAGALTIRARRFVIATGSRPAIPAIPGLEEIAYLTDETIFDLAEMPSRLVVLGGGATGVAMAQAFRRLGAEVTLIATEDRLLPNEDQELTAIVERSLREEGINLQLGTEIIRFETRPDGGIAAVLAEDVAVEGSHLLIARGRIPAIESLGLEAGKIRASASGILVNRRMRSSNSRVYAAGRASGELLHGEGFSHVAIQQASIAFRNAVLGLPVRFDPLLVPRIVHSDPELAAIGLTDRQARERTSTIRVLRSSFSDNERAIADGMKHGHVKAIVTPAGKILGCSIVGPRAGDSIIPWTLAMAKGLKVSDLAGLTYPHPGYAEASKSSAVEFLKLSAQNPWLRRVVGFVRRWG